MVSRTEMRWDESVLHSSARARCVVTARVLIVRLRLATQMHQSSLSRWLGIVSLGHANVFGYNSFFVNVSHCDRDPDDRRKNVIVLSSRTHIEATPKLVSAEKLATSLKI